jgi:hypothetical protein
LSSWKQRGPQFQGAAGTTGGGGSGMHTAAGRSAGGAVVASGTTAGGLPSLGIDAAVVGHAPDEHRAAPAGRQHEERADGDRTIHRTECKRSAPVRRDRRALEQPPRLVGVDAGGEALQVLPRGVRGAAVAQRGEAGGAVKGGVVGVGGRERRSCPAAS